MFHVDFLLGDFKGGLKVQVFKINVTFDAQKLHLL